MTMPSPQYQSPPQKATFNQRAKDRMVGRAQELVGRSLEPGEQVFVGLRVHTGPSNWWLMVPYVRLAVRLAQRYYFMLVTDRRVVLCRVSYWTGRPKDIKTAIPRAMVRISEYDPVAYYPSFVLAHPEASMKLRTRGMWLNELQQAMNILGAHGPAPQGAGAPGYQPAPPQYQAPPPGYQPAPPQYQPPPPGYQPPSPQYGAPPEQYGAPPQGHQAPQPGYQSQPQRYQSAPEEYDPPTVRYQPPPQDYEAPPPGSRRGRHAGGNGS